MDYFAPRRQRLAAAIADAGLDALVVNSPFNVAYLSGFTGDSSWLIASAKLFLLVSDGRYTQQITEECPGLDLHVRDTQQTIQQAVGEILARLALVHVGVEADHLSVAGFETLRAPAKSIQWSPRSRLVESLRMIKDEGEQAAIREAVRMAESAWSVFREQLHPDQTEKDLSDAMESCVRRAGAKATPFPTIAAVGERSALPHAPPTPKRVCEADFLLVDWGATGAEYRSDLTRMIVTRAASGRIESRFEKLYTVVLQAQLKAIDSVRPGVRAADVDAAVRSYLESEGLNQYFNHGLGHGIGLQTHEGPNIRLSSQDVLQTGMVFTIEPGVYVPGWGGIRIEDDVLVTHDGCEVLSRVPKDLASVLS